MLWSYGFYSVLIKSVQCLIKDKHNCVPTLREDYLLAIPYQAIFVMVSLVEIKGFDEFAKYAESLQPNGPPVLFYFSGSKLPNGDSWCPDCVEAEPVVKAFLGELDRNVTFAYVDVGDRDYWKDRACPFRTDPRTKLMVIPTIIKWKGVQRLEGSQCNKRELLQMLFEDED